jgi:hypothetical protein
MNNARLLIAKCSPRKIKFPGMPKVLNVSTVADQAPSSTVLNHLTLRILCPASESSLLIFPQAEYVLPALTLFAHACYADNTCTRVLHAASPRYIRVDRHMSGLKALQCPLSPQA